MSDRWLRNLYALIVMGLLLWPAPHFLLSRELASDPWKNLGLAMYATYFEVVVVVRHRDGDGPWLELREDLEARGLIEDYVERRRTQGRLREPRDLAEALRARTNAREIRIAVVSHQLDGDRGVMLPIDSEIYEYRF